MVGFAWDRVRAGLSMHGVFAVKHDAPVGQVIDDLLLLSEISTRREWHAHVLYLPLP